jgi:diguanylate cyclase (GGDEF)-like protein
MGELRQTLDLDRTGGAVSTLKDNFIPGKILVADDDFIVRRLTRAALEDVGCTIFECENGVSALNEFSLHMPDIVMLDVLMPGMSGFDVCSGIRALPEGADVPIVMMTALDDTESLVRAFQCGATDFITKPINLESLPYRMQYIFRAGKAFRDLRASEKKLSHAQKIAGMDSWEWDVGLDVLTFPASSGSNLGVLSDLQPLKMSSLIEMVHPAERDFLSKAVAGLTNKGLPLDIDCRWNSISGQSRYFHLTAEPRLDASGAVVSVTGTILDITERKKAEEKIRYLAYYDSLTALPNRSLFKEHLKHALAMAKQHKEIVAIMFIDLDRFKAVNDTLGHDAGDRLLGLVAERIRHQVRGYDTVSRLSGEAEPTVSRLGGDEFTILLEGMKSHETAGIIAQRVISSIEEPFEINGQEIFISASIGISLYPLDSDDVDCLVKYADLAMYSAKEFGRGAFQYYQRQMNEVSMRRLLVEKHLRKALEENSLSVVFQPQIDSRNARLFGLEALVRWTNRELGPVGPDIFIPVAEETGLVVPLDRWVLNRVCRHVADWHREGFDIGRVSVNFSAKHFQTKYVEGSIAVLEEIPCALRETIGIEITERTFVDNVHNVLNSLEQIVDSGIHISLDDFGTGYSSLSYLAQIPFHTLKIDRSFIQKINIDRKSMNIIIAIIALAKSLNKDVVAEGVETVEQLRFLQSHGCWIIQGYLYSKPLAADDLYSFLTEIERSSSTTCAEAIRETVTG